MHHYRREDVHANESGDTSNSLTPCAFAIAIGKLPVYKRGESPKMGNGFVHSPADGPVLPWPGRLEEGLAHIERALTLNPNQLGAWRFGGSVCWMMGDHEKSIRYYEHALQLSPQDFLASEAYAGISAKRRCARQVFPIRTGVG